VTVNITRDLIADRLGHVTYDRALFYLIGPWTHPGIKSFETLRFSWSRKSPISGRPRGIRLADPWIWWVL